MTDSLTIRGGAAIAEARQQMAREQAEPKIEYCKIVRHLANDEPIDSARLAAVIRQLGERDIDGDVETMRQIIAREQTVVAAKQALEEHPTQRQLREQLQAADAELRQRIDELLHPKRQLLEALQARSEAAEGVRRAESSLDQVKSSARGRELIE